MVMLGVATLVVVNSVMAGFSATLHERLNDNLSDIVIETASHEFLDAAQMLDRIRADSFLNSCIDELSAVFEKPGVLLFDAERGANESNSPTLSQRQSVTRPIRIIGIDPESYARLGGFRDKLDVQRNTAIVSFAVNGALKDLYERSHPASVGSSVTTVPPKGVILGIGRGELRPQLGDSILLAAMGAEFYPVQEVFVVVDFHDAQTGDESIGVAFVPIDDLQRMQGTTNQATGIKIKLKNYYQDKELAIQALARLFPGAASHIKTWEDVQGPLLQAIRMERSILNVLLFLIIAVAGCGILTLFSMMVNEKKRDIGAVRAMGASARSVFQIFLAYGFLLGVLGASAGVVLGLSIVCNINEIERVLSGFAGDNLSDRHLYFWRHYFNDIPTRVDVATVLLVGASAVVTAVLSSILPAWRAATLPPVLSLRSE